MRGSFAALRMTAKNKQLRNNGNGEGGFGLVFGVFGGALGG